MQTETTYQSEGYENRDHYLMCLSEEYGIALETVEEIAEILGSVEDFDQLVFTLEDLEDRQMAYNLKVNNWLSQA